MTALAAPVVDCPPRFATARTPGRETLGPVLARIAAEMGTPLMPWQRLVADVALELHPGTRRLVYRQVVLTLPRQQGKSTLLLALILTRALGARRQQIRYTAQTASDGRKKLLDEWLVELQDSNFGPLFDTKLVNGRERLAFTNGSNIGLIATTKKSGHGATLDLGILDEAFAHPDNRLELALKPAMVTRPDAQLWVVSAAGTRTLSPYLWEKVQRGRELAEAGVTRGMAYFEWSAPDDLPAGDPDTWRMAMPALGATITEEVVADDFESMDLREFERAYLNRWTSASSDPVIPLDAWAALTDPESELQDPIALAFDSSPERAWATISAAGLNRDGVPHVEVVDARRGTDWLPGRVAELYREHRPVAVAYEAGGPAADFIPQMKRLGVRTAPVSNAEYATAAADLLEAVATAKLRHLGTPELAAAIDAARRRSVGDGKFAWSRKSSSADITSLVSVTLALWASANKRRPQYVISAREALGIETTEINAAEFDSIIEEVERAADLYLDEETKR